MEISIITCNKCGKVCRGEYLKLRRYSPQLGALGSSDICEDCYKIMMEALDAKLDYRSTNFINMDTLADAIESRIRIERKIENENY